MFPYLYDNFMKRYVYNDTYNSSIYYNKIEKSLIFNYRTFIK